MPRKKPESLEEQRRDIAKRHKNAKVIRGKLDTDELSPADLEWLHVKAAFLKANDASYSFIADAIRIPKSTLKGWFEDETMKKRVAEIREDMVAAGVKYLNTYAIELLQILVEIARDKSIDANTRLRAVCEGLDRMGIAKVNKSESVTSKTLKQEFDLSDPQGIMESLKENPSLATAAASTLADLEALIAEGVVKDNA